MNRLWAASLVAMAMFASSPAQAGRYLVVDIFATGTGSGLNGSRSGSQPTIYFGFTTFYASFAYYLDGIYAPWTSNGELGFVGQIFDRRESGKSTASGFNVDASYASHFVNYQIAGNACYANATPTVVPTGSLISDPSCSRITANYSDGFAVDAYSFTGAIQSIAFREVEASALPSLTFSIPEPASWALMLVGFGLTGYALRRRRSAVRFAI